MAQNSRKNDKIHPGAYVRRHIIPEGMTVTKAAKLLGVGRPALSNFLNGNADLSKEMAVRLERTFGADSKHLIELQASFDHGQAAVGKESVVSGVYAPELAKIRAIEIQDWADKKKARHQLPALLRRLVHSTGRDLTRVDFPAFDNAEDRGLDGTIETTTPTPWIPGGKSGWQLTCRADIRKKAEEDYARGMKLVPKQQWSKTTFVFVVARNWRRKLEWAKEKAALRVWKDVRVYDASDLEQWLEQSAPGQIWFAERLGSSVSGYRSIEQCWREWTDICKRPLASQLFDSSVELHADNFRDWLAKEPEDPFVVAADSREEALAFLHCMARSCETNQSRPDHCMIVFDTPESLQRVTSAGRLPFVAVISTTEAEKKIGGLYRRCHCVIIRPRNNVFGTPDIVLDRLHFLDFRKALESMGYAYDEIERLARESGCSPTVLRRRLSEIPEVQAPSWANDADIARKLLPAALVGAWNNASPADREVVRRLARANDDAIVEDDLASLNALEDAPLWSAGQHRGVVSRIDALFGVAPFITGADVDNFLQVAQYVLSEKDPAMDLPANQRWVANLHGKVRDHSDVLRRGIRETLILLAVYGDQLFERRLGFNTEARVADYVRKLLTPFVGDRILSFGPDLPDYAEAAPEVVLSILETDLDRSDPVVCRLLVPAGSEIFSPPLRAPLLWAVQNLAWNQRRFARVLELLAKLCKIGKTDAVDNWSPKPEETLASLLHSWWPQTAASLEMRVNALKGLCRRHPLFGWSVCISQLELLGSANANHRPRWRDDKASASPQVTEAERLEFVTAATNLVLDWKDYDEGKLGDLVECLELFNESDQLRVWDLIDRWADATPSADPRANLRQRINGSAQMRRRRGRPILHPERERAASQKLSPPDRETRQRRLFAAYWVDLPPDSSDDGGFDQEKEEKRLRDRRLETLRDIWRERGIQGVHGLVEKSKKTSGLIGELMAVTLEGNDRQATMFLRSYLKLVTVCGSTTHMFCLSGFVRKTDTDIVDSLIDETERSGQIEQFGTLLLCMPFGRKTWRQLDDKPTDFQNSYWKRVEARTWSATAPEEINESVHRFLSVGRANAAFRVALAAWDLVETTFLIKLLVALPRASSDEYLTDPMTDDYNISMAFDELEKRSEVTVEEKARLEYAHITRLERSEHGIPNIERHISESPDAFALAIAKVYKRADGGEDPPELQLGAPDQVEAVFNAAHTLLDRVCRIPGADDNGNVNGEELKAWLGQVRSWCDRHDRARIGDDVIGSFMARAPAGEDGIWPCRAVCEALEWMASDEVGEGFVIGALNRRGVYMRGKGGDKEREHAERYSAWASELVFEYPYVAKLLERNATYYQNEAGWQDTETELSRRLSE